MTDHAKHATPQISDAREIGKKYGLSGVVIVFHDDAQAGYVSWGHDRDECSWMRRYADHAYSALQIMWRQTR